MRFWFMADVVLVAIVAGVFTVMTAVVQVIGVRINTRQHGAAVERLERIEQEQKRAADELLTHRQGSQEYRELQSARHDQNVRRLQKIDIHIDAVDAHVKAVDARVKHLEENT